LDHHFRGNIRFERSVGRGKQKRWLPWINENVNRRAVRTSLVHPVTARGDHPVTGA
jgi:hypothetical protein